MTDEDLLEAFYEGDDESLDHLARRYEWLRHYALGLLPAHAPARLERAPDIVQTAWVKVMNTRARGSGRWQRRHGPVKPWLFAIVRNHARDEERVEARTPLLRDEPADAPDPRQGDVFDQCELRSVVDEYLRSLEQMQRDVVILKFWVEMRQSEIASTLHVSEATVSRCWAAARTELQGRLPEALLDDDR